MIVIEGDPLASISAICEVELVVPGGYAFNPAGIRIDWPGGRGVSAP